MIKNITRKKLILLAAGLVSLLFMIALLTILPGAARGYITQGLESAGLKPVTIEKIQVGTNSFTATGISLGPHNFSTIDSIRLDLSWPAFLFGGKADDMHVSGLHLTDQLDSLSALTTPLPFLDAETIKSLPYSNIKIDDIRYDVATPYGDLRIEGNLAIRSDELGEKEIQARIHAAQYQLTFETRWTGKTTPDNTLLLDGEIAAGKMNFGPIRASRTSGWVSLKTKDSIPVISGEIESGSGTIFSVPVQDINLVLGNHEGAFTFLLRSAASGTRNVKLYADSALSDKKSTFSLVLDIGKVCEFLAFLSNLKEIKRNIPASLKNMDDTRLSISYLDERRFAGGPLPFDIRTTAEGKEILEGHFLVYPDKLDVRGSAETSEEIAEALQKYFSIPADKVTGTALRLDGNLKKMFQPQSSSGVGAGIENNLSE